MKSFRFKMCFDKLIAADKSLTRLSSKLPTSTLVPDQEQREFMEIFPQIVRDLTESEEYANVPEVNKWFATVLERNVPNGKKMRSSMMKSSYKVLEDPNRLTRENMKLADILCWCLELNQSAVQILDDMYDASETRRGMKCWHKITGVSAANDSILLENGVFRILKRYFSTHSTYAALMELFCEASFDIAMGQTLEHIFVDEAKRNMNTITLDRYNTLVSYKTEPCAVVFPIHLAMHLANKFDPVTCRKLEPVLREMGNLIQVTNDFNDCYGNPDDTGKIDTDIQEGKFSWLITVALERASMVQKKILSENYGRRPPDAVFKVRAVYDELNMRSAFEKHKEQKLMHIKTQIHRISKDVPHKLFLEYLESIVEENNWKKFWLRS